MLLELTVKLLTHKQFFFQYSPLIGNENFAYVHHMLVYLCAGLNDTEVNDSAPCTGGVGESVAECRGGELIAGWAVGGEVSNTRPNIDEFHSIFHHRDWMASV